MVINIKEEHVLDRFLTQLEAYNLQFNIVSFLVLALSLDLNNLTKKQKKKKREVWISVISGSTTLRYQLDLF